MNKILISLVVFIVLISGLTGVTSSNTDYPPPAFAVTVCGGSTLVINNLDFYISSTSDTTDYNINLNTLEHHLKAGDTLFIWGNTNANPTTMFSQKSTAQAGMVNPGVSVKTIYMYKSLAALSANVTSLPHGMDYIGYDYESGVGFEPAFTTNEATALTMFDSAETAVHNYNSATGSSAKLLVEPSYPELRTAGWDWGVAAQHMDAIDMQFQAYVGQTTFMSVVTPVVNQIRSESPTTLLLIQTSLASHTVQENTDDIILLQSLSIDGTLVFFDNSQTTDLANLFTSLGR